MTTVPIKTQVTFDDLFYAIEQLNSGDFEKFLAKVLDLKAKRKLPDLNEEEIKLIAKINEGLAPTQRTRFQELDDKRKAETLTKKEHTELGKLVDIIEKLHLQRVVAIGKLAQIRQQSVPALMQQLNLQPFPRNG